MAQGIERVIFSHGMESGPWGSKITAMAAAVRELGLEVESIDYRGMADPAARVARLLAAGQGRAHAAVLVGSSMGGHVAAAAAKPLAVRGLFLLAPAFYMPGFEAYTPREVGCPAVVVHGWRDDIVPVEHGIRWAREQGAALHVLDSGHRLEDQIEPICRLLCDFIAELQRAAGLQRGSGCKTCGSTGGGAAMPGGG